MAGLRTYIQKQGAQQQNLRRRHGPVAFWLLRLSHWLAFLLLLAAIVIAGFLLAASRAPVGMPGLRYLLQERLNGMDLPVQIALGEIHVYPKTGILPNVLLIDDTIVTAPSGAEILTIPHVEVTMNTADLLLAQPRPEQIVIEGVSFDLRRSSEGEFLFDLESEQSFARREIGALFDEIVTAEGFGRLEEIRLDGVGLRYRDDLYNKSYASFDSFAELTRLNEAAQPDAFRLRIGLNVAEGATAPTRVLFSGTRRPGSHLTSLAAQFFEVPSAMIAEQSLPLNWLLAVETAVNGAVTLELSDEGQLAQMSGVLELLPGQLRPRPDIPPVAFQSAKFYTSYDAASQELILDDVEIQSEIGALRGSGWAQIEQVRAGRITSMVTQLDVGKVVVSDPRYKDEAREIGPGRAQMRLGFAPFSFDLASAELRLGQSMIVAQGYSRSEGEEWVNRYDLFVPELELEDVRHFWPDQLAPKAREWIEERAAALTLKDITISGRAVASAAEYQMNFDFEGVEAGTIRGLPYLQNGAGSGVVSNDRAVLNIQSGDIPAEGGGAVSLKGTQIYIPNIKEKPPEAQIDLALTGALRDALWLADRDRFSLMQKAGLTPEIGAGTLVLGGQIHTRLQKGYPIENVNYELTGAVRDFSSTRLVPGRRVTASGIDVALSHVDGMRLQGNAALDGVAMNVSINRPAGPDRAMDLRARFSLSNEAIGQLSGSGRGVSGGGLRLSGASEAVFAATLRAGAASSFSFTSSLRGLSLSAPAIGWSKPASGAGVFELTGQLTPRFEPQSFRLEANGLSARGQLSLAGGQLTQIAFAPLSYGRALNVTGALRLPSSGRYGLEITSGRVDLSRLKSSGSGQGGGAPLPVSFALNTLGLTDTLSLSAVRGKATLGAVTEAQLEGRLNGSAPLSASYLLSNGQSRLAVYAKDAGALLNAAGGGSALRDGTLTADLRGQIGKELTGQFEITNARVRESSIMAQLLNALSIVGLIQQLNGSGIHFLTIEGGIAFRPGLIVLRKIAAVGPSMGMTADGYIDQQSNQLAVDGVITPIYIANGVWERLLGPLFGRGKGEGLFSFTYRLRGTPASPKVSANPFSILTPGVFREIFRQDPPAPPR